MVEVYKESEKPTEEIRPIYRRVLEYVREKKFDINHSTNKGFIDIENHIWKFLNEVYKPGQLTKGIYDVADIFRLSKNKKTPRVEDYIGIYLRSHDYNERVLKNMDSEQYRTVRHNLYRLLTKIYT